MKKLILFIIAASLLLTFPLKKSLSSTSLTGEANFWKVRSIDTMKYSRDLARIKLNDDLFDAVIDQQVRTIFKTGATHVAIATPYDEEFLPFLKKWVSAARRYNLNVWFRGNWSGWEGWFEYKPIDRKSHISKTINFIRSNRDLFENGDIFSTCPECENGGPGDPRNTGDVAGHREFLINEYSAANKEFKKLKLNVAANYESMNLDVARLIMDEKTTSSMSGIVVVDHYVASPEQFAIDIESIAQASKGTIVLGEFGAPIPSIHGELTEEAQALWLDKMLSKIASLPTVSGVNYWVGTGGSTELWSAKGNAKKGVEVLRRFYSPSVITITVLNSFGNPLKDTSVIFGKRNWRTNTIGIAQLPIAQSSVRLTIEKQGYYLKNVEALVQDKSIRVILEKQNPGLLYRLIEKVRSMLPW